MKEYIARFAEEGSRNHSITNEEIVRCKDCWWQYEKQGNMFCMKVGAMLTINPNGFCSYGTRGDEYGT